MTALGPPASHKRGQMSRRAADTSVSYFTFVLWRRQVSLLYLSLSYFGAGKHSKKYDTFLFQAGATPQNKLTKKRGSLGESFCSAFALLGSRRWSLVWGFLFLVASLVSVWLGFRFASLILSRSRVLGVPVLGSFFLFPSFLIIYYTDFIPHYNPFVKLI